MTVLASVDDYLPEAGALDRALLPLGFVLAFCAQHGLLSETFLQHRGEQLSSVRLQESQIVQDLVPLSSLDTESFYHTGTTRQVYGCVLL